MGAHQHKGFTFDVPDQWVNRTVVAFSAPASPGVQQEYLSNIVVVREALAEGETLRTHADRTLLEMARLLEGFDILETRDTTLGGLRAVHVRFRWTSSAGELEQGLTMCESPAEPGDTDRFATLITTSADAKVAAEAGSLFNALLSSFRFVWGAGEAPRSANPPSARLGGETPRSANPPSAPLGGEAPRSANPLSAPLDQGLPESPIFGSRRR